MAVGADARTKKLALVTAVLATAIAAVDSTAVNVALPAIGRDLGGGFAAQQWVSNAYLLTLSALILLAGSLTDRLGEQRVFRAGVAGFGIGSAAQAQFKVRYPIVDYREFEIEHFADTTFGPAKSGQSNNQRYTNEYGFGPLPNWFVELGNEFRALNGENITYDATEIENYLQLMPFSWQAQRSRIPAERLLNPLVDTPVCHMPHDGCSPFPIILFKL